jgi:hypothetical protein
MSTEVNVPVAFPRPLGPLPGDARDEGLLITADQGLARTFLGTLRSTGGPAFDVRSSMADAQPLGGGRHRWVVVDLDGALPPADTVGLARRIWPTARIAIISAPWSEQEVAVRGLADMVIHKPLRSHELRAFLQSRPLAAPGPAAVPPAPAHLRDAG